MSGSLPTVYEFQKSLADAEAPLPIPAGDYRATVKLVEARLSKSSNKPMLDVTYHISADQYPADYTEGDPDGALLHTYVTLADTPRGRFQLRKFCEMHGVVPSSRLNITEFMGTEVIVKIEHEDYQGMPQARATPVREA